MAERREKPGKARDSRTLIDNNYMLTKDDPIDKVQKGAFKGIPVPFKEGHYYIIDMTSKYDDKKNKILDPFLRLEDPDGKQVASDDDSGGNLDAEITYFCDRSGPFTVIATTYDRKTGPFHLTVRELPRIPEEDKLVVEQGIAHKNGELTWDDYEVRNVPCKVYALRLDKGQLCQIDMASNDFDALLRFENATGKELYVNDNGGGGANARIVFNCEESGNYRVVATSTVARTGAFELIVQTR
jgi:hypothetical protein